MVNIGKKFKRCPKCKNLVTYTDITKNFEDDIVDSSTITINCPFCKVQIELWVIAEFYLLNKEGLSRKKKAELLQKGDSSA